MTVPMDQTPRTDPLPPSKRTAHVLLVTGISGAGKSTALKALEDLNYEAVDNVPLSLIEALVIGGQRSRGDDDAVRPLAIGVDIRTRGFGVDAFLTRYDALVERGDIDVETLFVDCDDDELGRRFEETRRRHPLAIDRPVSEGIARERQLLAPLRDRADLTVDTSGLGPGELKRILSGHFSAAPSAGLTVFVTSFSFARGLPRDSDLVFDVRFLTNPHYEADLKPLTGKDPAVAEFIANDPGFAPFFDTLTALLAPLMPRYQAEGKSYLTIAVGCTGGRHRSVFVAEQLAKWFESQSQQVQLFHRDVETVRNR